MSLKTIGAGLHKSGFHDEAGILTYRLHRWYMVRFQNQIQIPAMITAVHRYVARAGRPDLFHVHTANYAGFAAERLAREYSIPFLITEHESGYFRKLYSRKFLADIRKVFDQAACVVCVSTAAGKVLTDLGLVKADKLRIIPNMVDADVFSPPPTPPPSPPFRFLTVGLLRPVKRFNSILRAFAQAFPGDQAIQLEVGGDGQERPALEALARELNIGTQVTFLGALSRVQVRDAMRRAHAYILASAFETFGVALIEALASGIPVVATACGGPLDIVSPEVGRLVPVDDLSALATALQEIRLTHKRYTSRAVRAYALQRFAVPVVSAQIAALYQQITQDL